MKKFGRLGSIFFVALENLGDDAFGIDHVTVELASSSAIARGLLIAVVQCQREFGSGLLFDLGQTRFALSLFSEHGDNFCAGFGERCFAFAQLN